MNSASSSADHEQDVSGDAAGKVDLARAMATPDQRQRDTGEPHRG